jgi:predicted transcriptional regulator
MSAPKIAALLGATGFFGVVVVAIRLGEFAWADYLLYAAFVCLGLAAVIMILHFFIALWKDFTRSKRRTPLDKLFNERETIHSVGPNTLVTECVRTMSTKKIGALIVLDGERLVGIFTERDALNKVLAAGLEPGKTKVSEVMTKDPYSIPATTTVGEAMELVTKLRFRHLPIVKNGKVLAVVSSGDLTHWLVKDQVGEVQELVDLAVGS